MQSIRGEPGVKYSTGLYRSPLSSFSKSASQKSGSNSQDRPETNSSYPKQTRAFKLGLYTCGPSVHPGQAPYLLLPLISFNQFTNLVILFFYSTALFKDLLLQSFIFLNSKYTMCNLIALRKKCQRKGSQFDIVNTIFR